LGEEGAGRGGGPRIRLALPQVPWPLSHVRGDGDLLVIPEIVLPTELSAEAQEAFDKFVKLAPQENPRKDLLKKAK